ncbi:MAG: hypothetical protein JWN44_4809 [Myxococcales bacterium]|nr:hypothetical protein [Myxococcales bacterium]
MRAAISLLVMFVAVSPSSSSANAAERADAPERILGMALAEAQLGHCTEALAHLDQYLAATASPSPDAFDIMRRCPRQPGAAPATGSASAPAGATAPASAAAAPTSAPVAHKPRGRWFLVDVEAGVNVPITSATRQAAFLGTLELGVAVSNRLGLDVVLLAESLVSRAVVTADGLLSTIFSENLLVGVEERRVIWRRLSVFGTVAIGFLVDSYRGFRSAAALHFDAGVGWTLGPGDLRLRPLDFGVLIESDRTVGASWRGTAGYALRF